MKTRVLFFITALFSSFFVGQNVWSLVDVGECATSSVWNSVKINEISSYDSADWVELYNLSGVCVDLTGLKIWDTGISTAMRVLDNMIIEANDWLWVSVSSRLNRDSDSVILKNGEEELDWLDYGGVVSAPQENEFLARIPDGSGEWVITATGTPGRANALATTEPENILPTAIINLSTTTAEINSEILFDALSSVDADGVLTSWWWNFGDGSSLGLVSTTHAYTTTGTFDIFLEVMDDDGATSTSHTSIFIFDTQTNTSTVSSTLVSWSDIKINEVVSDPENNNEMVELYNISDFDFNLLGGVICDFTESSCKAVSGTIFSQEFLVVDLQTTRYLNNDGDSVILKDDLGNKIDEINYGSSLGAPVKGQSLARKVDGVDSDVFSNWAITTQITLGSSNTITAPIINPPSGGGSNPASNVVDNNNSDEVGGNPECVASSSVIIYEIFPNPSGDDLKSEYIKIKNVSAHTINLSGWILKDLAREFNLSGEILAGEILEFSRATTSIALNNSGGEAVSLIDACGNIIDSWSYEKAEEDFIWGFDQGVKVWIFVGENDEENVVALENDNQTDIIWVVNYPSTILAGDKVWFDVSPSADKRGGNLNFTWDFASSTLVGDKQELEFNTTGTFYILISATSTAGSVGQTEIEVVVPERLENNIGVFVAEVFANPLGVDVREYIKIKNASTTTIEISNWQLKYNGKIYQIPDQTFVESGESLIFYKVATKFSLSNTGGVIELWNSEKKLVDDFEFAKSAQGEILVNDNLEISADKLAELVKDELSKQTNKNNNIQNLSLEEIRGQAQAGDLVKTVGKVVVLPGIFGSQYFYISDGKFGVQVYQYYKNFPEFKVGDVVQVVGEISIASGVKRIKVSGAEKIMVVDRVVVASAKEVKKIDELDENSLGSLIKIAGEITEKKSGYLYLDDGSAEMKIYFKPGSKISSSNFVAGENLVVVGILENTASGWQVWPRSQDDLNMVAGNDSLVINYSEESISTNNSQAKAESYLTATGGGITALILGFLARARGLVVLGFIKKVGLAVGKAVIRRG